MQLITLADSHAAVLRPHRFQASARRHDHLHGHVAARGRAQRDQPVAGLSRLRLREGAARSRHQVHQRGPEPVSADGGRDAPARAHRGKRRSALRAALRSRARGDGGAGRDLRHLHRRRDAGASRGRSDPVRAHLRLLCPRRRGERRRAGLRPAALSRLQHRLAAGAARDHAADTRASSSTRRTIPRPACSPARTCGCWRACCAAPTSS